MSAKSKKMKLNENFIAMWREQQSLWDVMPLCVKTEAYT